MLVINPGAILKNLEVYRNLLHENTKLMLMVKAYGYGAGDVVIARKLEAAKAVDYFGVAYINEGLTLREGGIKLPIMVMNPGIVELAEFQSFGLEPTIANPQQLDELLKFTPGSPGKLSVHIKINSGMHRLGFRLGEIKEAIKMLAQHNITISGVYTHLAASPNPEFDDFTRGQVEYFGQCYTILKEVLDYEPMRHVLNSAGILRFPEYQYEMVRAGMGAYGIEPAGILQEKFTQVSSFETVISQINLLKKGDTVGYERHGKILSNEARIAILPVGYADGYKRQFGNGRAEVFLNGKRAPTIGHVCMDMTFVDVTKVDCKVGDSVELFGANIDIQELAHAAETIDYEILTSIGPRVERAYI